MLEVRDCNYTTRGCRLEGGGGGGGEKCEDTTVTIFNHWVNSWDMDWIGRELFLIISYNLATFKPVFFISKTERQYQAFFYKDL